MAQVTAGETVTLTIGGHTVTAKIEDASKSESVSVKIESSQSEAYEPGRVYEFERGKITIS
jgi:catalase (peroxidase I)